MYLSEENIRKTLGIIASHSAPGSSVVLDYFNTLGIEYLKLAPAMAGGDPAGWGEPWLFGAPAPDGAEFFRELGFDPGHPLSMYNPELIQRYTIGKDGVGYGANVFEKTRRGSHRSRDARGNGTRHSREASPHRNPEGHRSSRRHLLACRADRPR